MPTPVTFTVQPTKSFPLRVVTKVMGPSPDAIVWNPLTSEPNYQLSYDRLTCSHLFNAANALLFATIAGTSGYCEFTVTAVGSGTLGIGFSPSGVSIPSSTDYVHDNGIGYLSDGRVSLQNVVQYTGTAYGSGAVIGMALKNGKAYFHLNGTYQNSADPVAETGGVSIAGLATAAVLPTIFTNGTGLQVTGRFTAAGMVYAIPSGITAWDGTTAAVAGAQEIDPPLLTNGQTFYGSQLNLTLLPALLTNSQSFFGPKLNLNVLPALLTNSQSFFGAQLNLNIAPPLLSNAQTFFGAKLNLSLAPPLLTNSQTFYGATLDLTLNPALLVNSQTFFGAAIDFSLNPPLLSNAQSFFASKINLNIMPALLTSAQTFFGAQLNLNIQPPLLSNAQTFYGPSTSQGTGAQTISAPLLTNDQSFYGATLGLTILMPLAANDNTFFGFDIGQHLQYPLADIPQHRPNEAANEGYPLTAAQSRPLTATQHRPLESTPQHYPLEAA